MTRPGEPAQAQPVDLQDALHVREQHLHLLALTSRTQELLGPGHRARHVAGCFVHAACHFSCRGVGATTLLERAARAVRLAGTVVNRARLRDAASGLGQVASVTLQCLAVRTCSTICLGIKAEVGSSARIRSVVQRIHRTSRAIRSGRDKLGRK